MVKKSSTPPVPGTNQAQTERFRFNEHQPIASRTPSGVSWHRTLGGNVDLCYYFILGRMTTGSDYEAY